MKAKTLFLGQNIRILVFFFLVSSFWCKAYQVPPTYFARKLRDFFFPSLRVTLTAPFFKVSFLVHCLSNFFPGKFERTYNLEKGFSFIPVLKNKLDFPTCSGPFKTLS